MSRHDHLKEKHGKSNRLSVDKYDDESAARTRPFSLEEIVLRRKKKELLENAKETAKEALNISPGGSSENSAYHFESGRIYKHDKSSFSGVDKLASEVKVNSKKKIEKTYWKEDNLIEGKEGGNFYSETKLSAGLSSRGRITKGSKNDKEKHSSRKNDGRASDCSEHEAENKHTSDSTHRDRHVEIKRRKYERIIKKKYQHVDDENPGEYNTERKHDKDSYDRGKRKNCSDDSEKVAEKKHQLYLASKDRHAGSRGKHEREFKRKYGDQHDDKIQDRNAARKQDLEKHRDPEIYDKRERKEIMKSHHEESRAKRRWSRSQECEERRRKSPLSPRVQKCTYDGKFSDKNRSRKPHSDVDRSKVSTNGSSSHHHRHGEPTSGLGGYSPRKRKTEAAVKTPSPSKHSLEKKRAGWDLPPIGADNSSSAFQLSTITLSSVIHDVAAATPVDPAIVKPLSISLTNDSSTGKNANIDSVQLTQATRPMRRLYLENLPASTSEKAVMECLNKLLLSAGVNHIQGAQPCISCILHKDKGQALVEFLTAEDASAALSFDGSTLFGCIVKIRRPKDYVEVTTGELERSVEAAVTISDVVIDSPDKIFIGGISKHLSSEMLMEIAGAFGSLKAYHFEADGRFAFLEYVDHSVTLKACVGLNGMKLAGEVLTVIQAMPNVSCLENGGKPPSYEIPEHAKPLLSKPTQVLKIKNMFTVEALSSLSDMETEEILEDVRLECARFGTIRSINVAKLSSESNEATKLDERNVINDEGSNGASQDFVCDNNAESTFSEKASYPESVVTSGVEFHDGTEETKEDKFDDGSSVSVDKLAVKSFDDESRPGEQIVSDTTIDDMGNKSIPCVVSKKCPDYHNTSTDQSELHDDMIAGDIGADIENKIVANDTYSKYAVYKFQEGFIKPNASLGTELVGSSEGISKEDDICDHVIEPGSILVEYARTEACCSAAHCLHGRFFDGRMVTVEYVALSLYRARFTR